jgi:hypothetical protein
MDQNLFWEANTCSHNQEILSILWNLKVQYHSQKNLPLILMLSQIQLCPLTVSLSLILTLSSQIIILFVGMKHSHSPYRRT